LAVLTSAFLHVVVASVEERSMNEFGGETPAEGLNKAAIDRRRLLKTAAAAGVGVAVWSTPSITSIGGTPAYAQVCTDPVLRYRAGATNTSCSCEGNSNSNIKYIDYKPLGSACATDPNPVSPISVVVNADQNGSCAPGSNPQGANSTNGTASVTIGSNPNSLYCVLEVQVTQGNCGGTVLATVTTGVVPPTGGTTAMPLVACGSGFQGNLFVNARLKCSTDPGCL
jgi:hypothetical protein